MMLWSIATLRPGFPRGDTRETESVVGSDKARNESLDPFVNYCPIVELIPCTLRLVSKFDDAV